MWKHQNKKIQKKATEVERRAKRGTDRQTNQSLFSSEGEINCETKTNSIGTAKVVCNLFFYIFFLLLFHLHTKKNKRQVIP